MNRIEICWWNESKNINNVSLYNFVAYLARFWFNQDRIFMEIRIGVNNVILRGEGGGTFEFSGSV